MKTRPSTTPLDPGVLKAAEAWDAIARMHGYNEMAKEAKTLGQRVYCRMARDAACEEAKQLGADITRTEVGGDAVMTIDEVAPHIVFKADDIEMMREAVRVFDLEHPKP
jgi:hypothetical protein